MGRLSRIIWWVQSQGFYKIETVSRTGKRRKRFSPRAYKRNTTLPSLSFQPLRPTFAPDLQNCKRINLCCFRALSFVVICSTSNRKLHVLHIPKEKKKPNNEIIMIFNNSQHLLAPSLLRPLYFFLSFLLPFSFFPLILHLTNAGHPCASHSQSPQQSPGSLTSTNVPQQEIHFFL